MTDSMPQLSPELSARFHYARKRLAEALRKVAAREDEEAELEEQRDLYEEVARNREKKERDSEVKELKEQISDLKDAEKRGEDVSEQMAALKKELEELLATDVETEEGEEEPSDQEKSYAEYQQDPEAHLFSLRNDADYRAWFSKQLLDNVRSRDQIPEALEELFPNEPDIRGLLSQELGLDKEEESVDDTTEEEAAVDPSEFVKEFDPFVDPKARKYYHQNRSLALKAINPHLMDYSKVPPTVEKEAEQLARAFFNYVPPSLITDTYHVGQKKQSPEQLKADFERQISRLKKKDEKFSKLQTELQAKPELNKDKIKATFNKLEQVREKTLSLLGSVVQLIESSKGRFTAPTVQASIKQLSREATQLIDDANKFKASLEELEPNLLSEYEGVFTELLPILNKVAYFLANPTKQYVNTVSYLEWQENYDQASEEKYRQLYRMIYEYTVLQCRRQLARNPNLKLIPGVQNEKPAESLATSVLYGIPLRTVETHKEREMAKPEDYGAVDYEQYVTDPEEYERKLKSFKTEKEKEDFKSKVEQWKKQRVSTDTSASILHQIHGYLTQNKNADMVCPSCSSSWWSFQSSSFPNASSFVFNDFVFPRAAGRSSSFLAEAPKEKTHELYTWRFSPFQAPVGIISREGEVLKDFCGGLKESVKADEVVAALEELSKKGDEQKQKAQEMLDRDLEAGMISKELLTYLETTPYGYRDEQLYLKENEVFTITLPACSQGEADRNASLMKKALAENIPLDSSTEIYYNKKEFVIAKLDFETLQKKLEGKLCFHPRQAISKTEKKQPRSIAEVINRSINLSVRRLTKVLSGTENERVLTWSCPSCKHENSERVPASIAYNLKDSKRTVTCTNPSCYDSSHPISEVKYKLGAYLDIPTASLDKPIGEEEGTTAADLVEAKEEGPSLEDRQQAAAQKMSFIKDSLNEFGASKAFTIVPSKRLRAPIQLAFPELGEILVSEVLSNPQLLERVSKEGQTIQKALKEQELDLLPVIYKLGLVLPFAICKTCGSFHDSVVSGSTARCALVEKYGPSKQLTVGEAKSFYNKLQADGVRYPPAHVPDFVKLEEVWNSQKRSASKKKKVIAATEEDDFSLLGGDISDLLQSPKEEPKAEKPTVPVAKDPLEQVREDLQQTPAESDIGLDLLALDANPEALDQATEGISISEVPESAPKVPSSVEQPEDLLSFNFEQEEEKIEVIDNVPLEKALALLPMEDQKRIEGLETLTYQSGVPVDKIPANVLEAAKKAYQTSVVRAIVDNPMENMKVIFDEAFNEIQTSLKETV